MVSVGFTIKGYALQALRINPVLRIISRVSVPIPIIPDRVLSNEPAGEIVVVPMPKHHQAGIHVRLVLLLSDISERSRSGPGPGEEATEGIVQHGIGGR